MLYMYNVYSSTHVQWLLSFNKSANETCEGVSIENTTLVIRRVYSNMHELDPKKESIEDFYERFEFYCMANGICNDDTDKKKPMFVTLLG